MSPDKEALRYQMTKAKKTAALILSVVVMLAMTSACVIGLTVNAAEVSSAVTQSQNPVLIKDVSYDSSAKTVTIRFQKKVSWKSSSASAKVVRQHKTSNYVTSIKRRTSAKIIVNVKSLPRGRNYQFTVSGVKVKGTSGKYTSSKGAFSVK